jgi:hypothetical protein
MPNQHSSDRAKRAEFLRETLMRLLKDQRATLRAAEALPLIKALMILDGHYRPYNYPKKRKKDPVAEEARQPLQGIPEDLLDVEVDEL